MFELQVSVIKYYDITIYFRYLDPVRCTGHTITYNLIIFNILLLKNFQYTNVLLRMLNKVLCKN